MALVTDDILVLIADANRLTAGGNAGEAIALYNDWIARFPDHPTLFAAHFYLGLAYAGGGDLVKAAEQFSASIARNPDYLQAYLNLGNVLEVLGDRLGAVRQWSVIDQRLGMITEENIALKLTALGQKARVFAAADLDDPAEEALLQSLSIDPHQRDMLQHWLNARQSQCRWPLFEPLDRGLRHAIVEEMSPLSAACLADDPLWHLAHAAAFTRKEIGTPMAPAMPARPKPEVSHRPLRIGYLSSDLRDHAVGFLTAEIYGLHDRSRVEVFVYDTGPENDSSTARRIMAGADHWRVLRDRGDPEAARVIAADRIDILVDLNGHTHDARTALLGCDPAPIIVNWLGFPGSMGSAFHHYIIADDFIIPEGSELYYSERVARLPCYQPVDRQRVVGVRPQKRGDFDLPEKAMVFCCFNELRKITEETWQRWMSILCAVPESVLWLLVSSPNTQSHLRTMAERHGVDRSRLVFARHMPNADHLARYVLADLILDSFPYGAHTTASDALWMGVPVLTLAGHSFASRVCGSLLRAAGLPELVCASEEEYIAKAVALGGDAAQRTALRDRLRGAREHCLLFDTKHLVASLESLYEGMWQEYCRGELPKPDLSNMELYREIGADLASAGGRREADFLETYRRKLAERRSFSFLQRDRRLLTSS